ncbi:potassium channel family protein [Neobacillus rhizophilus]|uniref:Potassium channel family protein n=1 Tax=Neobacillus rhizophilus TaxID=2833579 RepID=A0A942YVM1_9BACI|nr:potassium channel family protein [Neobacillus rhizophilus]MBS4215233.1 potassium channel family protein [Neobacillus rhizophilus]
MKRKIGFVYECLLAGLIIFSLSAELPEREDYVLGWFIWGLFAVDYVIRLMLSKNKWGFVKNHPIELLALIPVDQLFRTLRLIRLIRLVRLILVVKRNNSLLDLLIEKYRFDKLFITVIALLFLTAIPMAWIEPSFDSYGDALWWTVVTTTTVGYGDLYPETTVGRLIASVLMFVGIGLIGVVTGTVASLFSNKKTDLPDQLKYVRDKIDDYPTISEPELLVMIEQLKAYQEEQKKS